MTDQRNPGRLAGRTAVVTGGASGIGAAAVRLFAREGARVAIADVAREKGEALARELQETGAEAVFLQTDITDPASVARMYEQILERFGALHVVVSNAGWAGEMTGIESYSIDAWKRILAINLGGAFHICTQALPLLKEQGGGSIIVTASLSAFDNNTRMVGYGATKAAVMGLVRSLAYDFGRYGIRVNGVCPGNVTTPLLQDILDAFDEPAPTEADTERGDAIHPMRMVALPEDIADLMLFLAGGESRHISGAGIVIDGALFAGVPRKREEGAACG